MNCHAYESSSTVPNPVCAHCGVKSIPYSSSVIDEYWNDCADDQIDFILEHLSESTHQVVLPPYPEGWDEGGIHPLSGANSIEEYEPLVCYKEESKDDANN